MGCIYMKILELKKMEVLGIFNIFYKSKTWTWLVIPFGAIYKV